MELVSDIVQTGLMFSDKVFPIGLLPLLKKAPLGHTGKARWRKGKGGKRDEDIAPDIY